MITEQALQEAIAEVQGKRNPNRDDCMMLAAFYIIQDRMYPTVAESPIVLSHSYAGEQVETPIHLNSDTEFSRIIEGRSPDDVFPIIDELMTTLQVLHPRLYDGVIRELTD